MAQYGVMRRQSLAALQRDLARLQRRRQKIEADFARKKLKVDQLNRHITAAQNAQMRKARTHFLITIGAAFTKLFAPADSAEAENLMQFFASHFSAAELERAKKSGAG